MEPTRFLSPPKKLNSRNVFPRYLITMNLAILTIALSFTLIGSQQSGSVTLVPETSWRLSFSESWAIDRLRERGLDPVVEQEYGVSRIERREYELNGESAEAFLFETPDPSSAYGLFTFYSTPKFRSEPGAQLTRYSPELGLMVRGRHLFRVSRPQSGKIDRSEFRALLVSIGGLSSSPASLAQLPHPIPSEGLLVGSEKYFLGPYAMRQFLPSFPVDVVGFSQGAEVQLGWYRSNNNLAQLILISYPTPQIARVRFTDFQNVFSLNEEGKSDSYIGRRSSSYVALGKGANSKWVVERVAEQLENSQEVTWNEPPQLLEQFALRVANLILGNLRFIGWLILFALTGGVLIFLVRWLLDRYLPQSILARKRDGGVIRLGLEER